MVIVDLEQPTRPAAELLRWSRTMVDPPLRAAVATLPVSTRGLVDYHFGWRDRGGRPIHAYGGKAVRPLLALLAAEAVGAPPEAALPAAVAVELVHNFSLVHDDIMDGDRTRRHRPTLWAVHGVGPAILAGNAMLVLAYQSLSTDVRATALLSATVQRLLDGQAADLAFEHRADVSLSECTAMAESKTAVLLSAATTLGALAGGGSDAACARLSRFGTAIGLAFQLADDLLGIWGDPAVTGKPARSDLHSAKKSLPVVAALNAGTPAATRLAELYLGETFSPAEAEHAAALIEQTGARTWCQTRSDDLLFEALRELADLGAPPRTEQELTATARLLTRRDH